MKIKIISIMLSIIAIFIIIIPLEINAATDDGIVMPRWNNVKTIYCTITFLDDGYGYAKGAVSGDLGVSKIVAEAYVYKQVGSSWVYVNHEEKTVASHSMLISCQFVPEAGAYYMANYQFIVTKNGVDEIITRTVYQTA